VSDAETVTQGRVPERTPTEPLAGHRGAPVVSARIMYPFSIRPDDRCIDPSSPIGRRVRNRSRDLTRPSRVTITFSGLKSRGRCSPVGAASHRPICTARSRTSAEGGGVFAREASVRSDVPRRVSRRRTGRRSWSRRVDSDDIGMVRALAACASSRRRWCCTGSVPAAREYH